MNAKKRESGRTWTSDMAQLTSDELERIDAHIIQADEYDEAPELTDEMRARAVVKKDGRPRLAASPFPPIGTLELEAPRRAEPTNGVPILLTKDLARG